ncbi:MAG: malate synthase G [Neisseriaceae bacterium]|nr:MAG: malate synthase G [Neisseriaceae bacterium]
MCTRESIANLQVEKTLFRFIEKQILAHHPSLTSEEFWPKFAQLLKNYGEKNQKLLDKRKELQTKLDDWNKKHQGQGLDTSSYKDFLKEIGYLVQVPEDFKVSTQNVDTEITEQSGPQLVVPVGNTRYALNAVNARWGSLYDALYGTDVIDTSGDLAPTKEYNIKRGEKVIEYTRNLLDQTIPLKEGSHKDSTAYQVVDGKLQVILQDGRKTGLHNDDLFIGYQGSEEAPNSILFKHNGLHLDLLIDRGSFIGKTDPAGVKDVIVESAVSTIMDLEDSTAAVDGKDKTVLYHNWLGLLTGTLKETVTKNGQTFVRKVNPDREYTSKQGEKIKLKGRSLLFIRNVGLLMRTPAILDENNQEIFEGILDGVITALVAPYAFANEKTPNSIKRSVYIVKPKMHGPEEVAFVNDLFDAIEDLTYLPRNTLKIGLMDEERRTSLNLKACIEKIKERIVFINTGFLDRTGDEIHTNMHLGAMVRKGEMKKETWFDAYELNNVEIGLQCGLTGKAQIGKGMWAIPDNMADMLREKINHPKSGATTAWVPNPTAATLHALHYHQIDVYEVQKEILKQPSFKDYTDALLTVPVAKQTNWSQDEIKQELDNNCQGILGYVVRWVEQGIGCSKVPDIHDVGLMEDRATCRISSQHVANWFLHGVIDRKQVEETLQRMAVVVDKQNEGDLSYVPMEGRFDTSCAFLAASDLIFKGLEQPSGYTEPLLHAWRLKQKRNRLTQ